MASPRRERLVETALRLFYQRGFHATGIDAILAEAGVAKMTLYNHFKSKEDLILAALQRCDQRFRNWLVTRVEQLAAEPRDRLLAVFDALGEWIRESEFNGCMSINASAEYADPSNPIHHAAAEHKRLLDGYLRELGASAGAEDPAGLARGLTLLFEGSIVWAQTTGDTAVTAEARAAASTLVDAAVPAGSAVT